MSTLHVLCKVGEAEYALPADDVVQLESFQGATPVPGAAPHVTGIVQLRGKVLPVLDLRARFGLPPVERGLASRLVVVRCEERQVALLADSAREVVQIAEDAFRTPPELVAGQGDGFVRSVADVSGRLVLRLDVSRVLGEDPAHQEKHAHG